MIKVRADFTADADFYNEIRLRLLFLNIAFYDYYHEYFINLVLDLARPGHADLYALKAAVGKELDRSGFLLGRTCVRILVEQVAAVYALWQEERV